MLLTGCGGSGTPVQHESAVLITIDTFRADSFGAGGHPDLRTPALDRFFRNGLQFSQAFSPSATTLSSHASLLTGAWPTTHGVVRNASRVPASCVTLAEILSEEGLSTAAFVSSVALDPVTGIGQGFGVHDFRPARIVDLDQPWRPAPRTLRAARNWWESRKGRRFLWVHVFEPHFPYEPPDVLARLHDPAYQGTVRGDMPTILSVWEDPATLSAEDHRHLRALYLAEIVALDRRLGTFLRELERAPSTAVVVTSDHGESLGEHDLHFRHGPHVYPADVAVPLAVRGESVPRGVVSSLVRTIDVPGTLLALLGVDAELPAEASDLLRWTRDAPEDLRAFALASQPWFPEDARSRVQRAVRTGEASYVETPWRETSQWFDRGVDPGELSPRDPRGEEKALRAELDAWIEGAHAPADSAPPALRERLRSLGYAE